MGLSPPPADEHRFAVVFVCTGNRARSPIAEALLRERARGAPVDVGSRGTSDVLDSPALPDALTAAAGLGVDLSGHRSRPLATGELAGVDLVVGFEPFHVAAAVVDGGARREVAFTLPELAELLGRLDPDRSEDVDVPERARRAVRRAHAERVGRPWPPTLSVEDPLGKGRDVFVRVAREIDAAVDQLVVAILGSSTPTQ